MIFYLQLDNDNIIRDAITYPVDGYVEYETNLLPISCIGGWFKLENNEIVEYPELKPIDKDTEIEALKQSQAEQDSLIMQLILGGME